MASTNYRVRRATVDDMQSLAALWQTMHFPTDELEKRLKEFQLVESLDGQLLGAVALEIQGRHGRIHHEAFTDFSLADPLRPLLWERIQSLAANHGLFRFWTQERAAFWKQNSFRIAHSEALQKMPEPWDKTLLGWLTLQIRDEAAIEAISLDKEFNLFMAAERQRTEQLISRAKTLKVVATLIAFLAAFAIFGAAAWLYFARKTGGSPIP